jgi:hypothetical protein
MAVTQAPPAQITAIIFPRLKRTLRNALAIDHPIVTSQNNAKLPQLMKIRRSDVLPPVLPAVITSFEIIAIVAKTKSNIPISGRRGDPVFSSLAIFILTFQMAQYESTDQKCTHDSDSLANGLCRDQQRAKQPNREHDKKKGLKTKSSFSKHDVNYDGH